MHIRFKWLMDINYVLIWWHVLDDDPSDSDVFCFDGIVIELAHCDGLAGLWVHVCENVNSDKQTCFDFGFLLVAQASKFVRIGLIGLDKLRLVARCVHVCLKTTCSVDTGQPTRLSN